MPEDLKPQVFDLKKYISPDRAVLFGSLLNRSLWNKFHWRGDPEDRIVGGRRRALVLEPTNSLERLILSGSKEMQRLARLCAMAADIVMQQEIGVADWKTNRIAINHMPPHSRLPEHPDPVTFRDGVISIGLGRAIFSHPGGEVITDDASLMYIPAGMLHGVQNLATDRFSIAMINDTNLEAGGSLTAVYAQKLVDHVVKR